MDLRDTRWRRQCDDKESRLRTYACDIPSPSYQMFLSIGCAVRTTRKSTSPPSDTSPDPEQAELDATNRFKRTLPSACSRAEGFSLLSTRSSMENSRLHHSHRMKSCAGQRNLFEQFSRPRCLRRMSGQAAVQRGGGSKSKMDSQARAEDQDNDRSQGDDSDSDSDPCIAVIKRHTKPKSP